jgi:hypothetical protein
VLFVPGTTRNQVLFYSRFDHIVLLSAPPAILAERGRVADIVLTTYCDLMRLPSRLVTIRSGRVAGPGRG